MERDDRPLDALTSLAKRVFEARRNSEYRKELEFWADLVGTADPVLQEYHRQGLVLPHRQPSFNETVEKVFSLPELETLTSMAGQLDPLIHSAGGGMRASPATLLAGVLGSAFLQIYVLGLPRDESTFVHMVKKGLDSLKRAVQTGKAEAQLIFGLTGIALADGKQVDTPWGVLSPAPTPEFGRPFSNPFQPTTNCLLVDTRLLTIKFDRDPSPSSNFDPAEVAADAVYTLLPVACCLGSKSSELAVPLVSWSTILLPFQGVSGYAMPLLLGRWRHDVDITSRTKEIEEWSRLVHATHLPSIDVAARRLVSASGQRTDRADALIDAVVVWENIVGTDSETTFRVTASLAKALEDDKEKRAALWSELKKVYKTRSKVVHGVAVKATEVEDAAKKAIEVAVGILGYSYRRGRDWLSLRSNERADSLLLNEP